MKKLVKTSRHFSRSTRNIMSVSPRASCLLLLLLLLLLTSPGASFLLDWDHMTTADPLQPHFTECVSRNQESFSCWWRPGRLQNLTTPEDLRVFYFKKDISSADVWRECPDYVASRRECFFDANHTSIWTPYCLQLRGDNVTYRSEDDCFTVENIVRPDPPVSLNWTQLNASPSGRSFDVMVTWEAPPSTDAVWISLEYELQFREKHKQDWKSLEIQPLTRQPVYGLRVGGEYEVRVRSRMHAFVKFGRFSESVFVHVTRTFTDSSAAIIVTFGLLAVLVLVMLVLVTQQHRLMLLLLPPVPAPKIKGIDSEMLKKGHLDELNHVLSGGGMGALSSYSFFSDESWVEFIEVDLDEPDAPQKNSSDTHKLLSQPVNQPVGCSNSSSFPSTDSGRASCYDPDLPDQDSLMATLLPGQSQDPPPELDQALSGPQTWVDTDFYAQVSNVMPSGGVVLSPGQQLRVQEEKVQKGGPGEKNSLQLMVHGSSDDVSDHQDQDCAQGSVPDYTVVQEVDAQNSLLLNPPPVQAPPPRPDQPTKSLMPVGYVTPEVLGNISP